MIWNPDLYCGHSGNACPEANCGGCHAVVIVGYNDDDPNNPYWIVLNSWGSNAGRPNGFFRMKMNMNYDCWETITDHSTNPPTVNNYYDRSFQTIDTQGNPFTMPTAFTWQPREARQTTSGSVRRITERRHGALGHSSTGPRATAPSMATFNSRLYMAAKGVVTPKVYVRSMNYQGTWTAWTEVPGWLNKCRPDSCHLQKPPLCLRQGSHYEQDLVQFYGHEWSLVRMAGGRGSIHD